ncbi:MAG: VWA domain-containing protein [Rhodothermia bacterium]|nr:VWA domain-containing protein [Rhodothermia bacterium]
MELSLGHSTLLFVASALAAAAISFWMYRRTTPKLSAGRKFVLTSLRFVALTIILFLLARPILSRLIESRIPPVLAVLIDASQSIGVVTPDADSTAMAEAQRIASEIAAQELDGEVHFLAFDAEVRPVVSDSLDGITFDGQRTDIATSIERTIESYADGNLAGLLLISDGRFTAGRNPIHAADRSPVPIYTVALGDTTERRDIRIAAINTNELTYSGTEVPVQIGVEAVGFDGRRSSVRLSVNGEVVDSTPVDLPPDRVERTIELSFVPSSPGLFTVEARVLPLDGEITTRNNVASTAIRVLDSRRKILLVGGAPDPDVSSLYQTLSDGDETEVTRIVQRSGTEFYGQPFPGDLSDFDLLVLVGYPAAGASSAHLANISRAVQGGLPILFTLTRATDLRLYREHIASLVGAVNSSARRGFFDASFVLTQAGRRHPVFDGLADDEALQQLPPLAINESSWETAPDVSVLATTRVRGIDLSDPAIVTRRTGDYRAAAILGAGHWRLNNLPQDLSRYDDYWPTLLANLTQWLSATRDDRPVRVRSIRDQFAGDEQIEFTGQVYDESLNPIDDATVSVTITSPDGNDFRHTMKPIGSGRYNLDVRPLGEGSYRYRASASRNGAELGGDSGTFAIGNLTLEFRNTSADPVLMRQIAYRSGGQSIDPASIAELPALLAKQNSFAVRSSVARTETELWRQFPFAIVVILLLTAEWVLRKRSGLS